jgi:outer membrane protein TolC
MGLPITDSVVLTDNLQDLFANKKVTAFENETKYDNRVEYKLLKQQYSLNQLDKKRYLVGYMPTLYAFANQQYNAFASEGNFPNLYNKLYPGTNIGLSLNLPIFDGFRKHALTQQADISITKTENNMRLFENVVDQQVYQARTNFLRTTQQLEIQQSNLKLAEEIYSKAELKYKNGVGSSLELTTSQSDLENARTNLLTTAYEFFVAEIELKKALGMIK